jgi:predicted flap endonuclease-1-like 5' DNA nuclease
MGYAFAAVAAKDLGPFIAFALGAFPLTALTAMLRRLAGKTLNLDATQEEKGDDVTQLQGVNPTIAARLASEDITTVTQLAYCDPIRLVMRSNLTFNFVTDCMSQALAWLNLKDQLALLRPMGMRGAVEIESLIDELDYEPAATPSAPDEQAAAQAKEAHDLAVASFPKMAEKLAQTPETLQITFRQIAEDPFTIFLAKVWS